MATTVPADYKFYTMISRECNNSDNINNALKGLGYEMLTDSLKAIKEMIELLEDDEEILILTNLAEEAVYAHRNGNYIVFKRA